ncbi:MAG TPA: S9 family peptidase [Microscillaceae bacterium]|nr:S9 family peptidase [Microscillaceae bacterium]
MKNRYRILILFLLLGAHLGHAQLKYPTTKKVDHVDTYFGTQVPDPYRWMEASDQPSVKAWVKAQNKVTFGYLNKIKFRDKLKKRIGQLWNYKKVGAPFKEGNYYYYYANSGLQNQYVLYRKKSLESKNAEVFLDPNKFAKDGTVSMAGMSFTKDGKLVAYLTSTGGADFRDIYVMDAETKKLRKDRVSFAKFTGVSWKGNEGFYYSTYGLPKKGEDYLTKKTQRHMVYYHKLGTPQSQDQLVFGGDKMPRRYVSGYVTEDGTTLIISAANRTTGNELYYKDLTKSNSKIIPIVKNMKNRHGVLMKKGDKLYIQTNLEAPNNRVVITNMKKPEPSNWKDIIPETKNTLSIGSGGGYLFASYLVDVKTQVKQYTMEGKLVRTIKLPGIGTARGFGAKQKAKELYYSFTSFNYPGTTFKYNIATGKSTLYRKPNIDFNPEDYVTKQVFYKSKDGTKVPMFIVHKKGVKLTGKNPTYLYAYGGFNVSLRPSFSVARLIWLELGGIYAQPNLRGGGEYGAKWHKAGTKMQKQNVFDDFIAAAEYLIKEKYTSSDYLAVAGGSNGGLLVGATMTQRPKLMKVALPAVGVLDMLRYHKFTSGAGWAYDYGTADDSKEMFNYLKGYSPLHNLKKGVEYPATMVTTADHDDRVVPAHSFKFAATLQEMHRGKNPVLIRIESDAGHGSGTPTSKRIEQYADIYSFVFYNMGVNPYNENKSEK